MTPFDPSVQLRQILGVGARQLLTMQDLVRDYPNIFPSPEAARKWVRRHLPFTKSGRKLLVDRRELHAYWDARRQQAS